MNCYKPVKKCDSYNQLRLRPDSHTFTEPSSWLVSGKKEIWLQGQD